MNTLITLFTLFTLLGFTVVLQKPASQLEKTIQKNGMSVTWYHLEDRIFFELEAPTSGWLTIGFNETNELTGAYLIMTRVYSTLPDVVEHHVISPGNYKPIEKLNINQIADVEGEEIFNLSRIRFSLKADTQSNFRKSLIKGTYINMIMAYSRSDDFQHHSVMRTTVRVLL